MSTAEQTTENQRLEIEAAGYAIDCKYSDTISGKTSASQRAQFVVQLAKIHDGETLIVSKLDRIGRDAQDVGATIKLLKAHHIKVIVLQLGTLDSTSPAGKLMLNMLSAVAEMERDLLVERTHAGLTRAKAEGKKLGGIPKTTAVQREAIKAAYAANVSVSALVRENTISRATVLNLVAGASAPGSMPVANGRLSLPSFYVCTPEPPALVGHPGPTPLQPRHASRIAGYADVAEQSPRPPVDIFRWPHGDAHYRRSRIKNGSRTRSIGTFPVCPVP